MKTRETEYLDFEWDEKKNRTNIWKHGVSFEKAQAVFDDEYAILFDDPEHSMDEERFLILGEIPDSKVLVVSHCYRGERGRVRIISARKATKSEKKTYHARRGY